jgi:hypothetical protein
MRGRILGMGGLLVACVVLLTGSFAGAATIRVGTLVLHADGGFRPYALPKRTFAPIHFHGYGDIKTTNGSVPPALQHVEVEFDHDGLLTTTGLSVCQPSTLEGASTRQARNRCGAAVVGTGRIGAAVPLAGTGRIDMSAPLTIFNGPRRDGNPTAILHAQAPFPLSETYVVVAPIERRRGAYGYRSEFDVPPIAGGLGSLTHISAKIGREYRAGGVERSYASARCADYILRIQGYFSFADGNVIYGSAFKSCRPTP